MGVGGWGGCQTQTCLHKSSLGETEAKLFLTLPRQGIEPRVSWFEIRLTTEPRPASPDNDATVTAAADAAAAADVADDDDDDDDGDNDKGVLDELGFFC